MTDYQLQTAIETIRDLLRLADLMQDNRNTLLCRVQCQAHLVLDLLEGNISEKDYQDIVS